jgi:hypothetical protein
LLLAGDNATMYQLSFQDPATTSMEGIYLFNLHLLFAIISIVMLVGWLLSIILKNFIELLLLAVFNLNFATFSTYLTLTRRVLILKNFTFELKGWDVEKFESIDPTDNFGYNTRSYSYSRQAYASQSDCGMSSMMASAKSAPLVRLFYGIFNLDSFVNNNLPVSVIMGVGVVGVIITGIYYIFKGNNTNPKDFPNFPSLKNDTDSLTNTELLPTESLVISTTKTFESSSSSFVNSLGNNFSNFNANSSSLKIDDMDSLITNTELLPTESLVISTTKTFESSSSSLTNSLKILDPNSPPLKIDMNLLNNTELLSTRLEEIAEELTDIASSESSSSSFPDYLLENDLVTEPISNLLINHNHYSAVLGYSAVEIPIIYSPIMVYVALKNLAVIKQAYPTIFVSPEHKTLLENLLKEKLIRYAAANAAAAAKEPLIYYHEGYGPINLYNFCVPTKTFSLTGSLVSTPKSLLTPLDDTASKEYNNSTHINNLKVGVSYWCQRLPVVEANPSTYPFVNYTMNNDFGRINQTLDANNVNIPMSIVDTWLVSLPVNQNLNSTYVHTKIFNWSLSTSKAIKEYNLLKEALKGSAVAGEFEDLDIAINDLAVSKKFLASAMAEFKNNVTGDESFHATQEQKRFFSFCLETENDYLLNLFLTSAYERPNATTFRQTLPCFDEGNRTGRNLLMRYMHAETKSIIFIPNCNLSPKIPSLNTIVSRPR